jgi:hypothetical protein
MLERSEKMMEEYTISLFGHKELRDFRKIEETLYTVLCDLMRQKQYVSIFVGRDGEFVFLAASVVKKSAVCDRKRKEFYDTCSSVLPEGDRGL